MKRLIPLLAATALFVAVVLMVTVIGIPAGIGLLVVLWPAVAFIGYIVAAIWLVIGLVPFVTAILSNLGLGAVVLASWPTLRGGMAQPRIKTQPAPIG